MIEDDFKPPIEDSYEDKQKYLEQNIMMDPFMNGADLYKAVGLICFIVQNNRKKVNPEYTAYEAVDLIIGEDVNNKVYQYFKERIPLICELFLQDSTAKFDTYGLKTRDEIIGEVRRLLDEWIPF